jgi:ABC-type branched-subunit amino acid transport system ATPase component
VNSSDPILTLDQVTKNFGGLRVVEDLSFSVRRGSCTALIGPNGAGKTTVFNLITGVYPIDAGRILFDGVDISRVPSRRRIHCGVARNFQNIRLMPHLSTLENVLVGQHCQNSGWRGVLQRSVSFRAIDGARKLAPRLLMPGWRTMSVPPSAVCPTECRSESSSCGR